MGFLEAAENGLIYVVQFGTMLFEYIGVIVLILTGVRGVIRCIKKDPAIRLTLARGLALGLEFKLGSEILRTVVVRDLSEVAIVGAIILLRGALAFLIHWEIKNEKKEKAE